jgi:tetraacyldisaccharide 4'-kinase
LPPSKHSAKQHWLERIWQTRGAAAAILLPLAAVFVVLRFVRRTLYRIGFFRIVHLPVPVVVVGNITVGGVGKTPLVIHLARRLTALGWRVGIISRGYGRKGSDEVAEVFADSNPEQVGDEPVLIAQSTGCPLVAGADRVKAAHALLLAHPEIQVILSDDGLQHYRLGREFELVVTSSVAELNGWPLPAGPMREPRSRLRSVDAVVVPSTEGSATAGATSTNAVIPAPTLDAGGIEPSRCFRMATRATDFYSLTDRTQTCTADAFNGLRLHALAGIGNPQRFFSELQRMSIAAEEHVFPDHHTYRRDDLRFTGDAILTTEKDAVKLRRLVLDIPMPDLPALNLPVWVLPIDVSVEPDLAQFVVETLNGRTPA